MGTRGARGWTAAARLLALAGSAASLLSAAAAQDATSRVRATIQAVAGPAVPAIERVALQAQSAEDVDQRLEATITAALAARGIAVDAAAPLILTYDTEFGNATVAVPGMDTGVNLTELGDPGTEAEMAGGGAITPETGPLAPLDPLLPTFSEPFGSEPFGGHVGRGARPAGGQPYSLMFTIGMDGAPPVWTGSIEAILPPQDPLAVAKVMVPPLVQAIGRSGHGILLLPAPGFE